MHRVACNGPCTYAGLLSVLAGSAQADFNFCGPLLSLPCKLRLPDSFSGSLIIVMQLSLAASRHCRAWYSVHPFKECTVSCSIPARGLWQQMLTLPALDDCLCHSSSASIAAPCYMLMVLCSLITAQAMQSGAVITLPLCCPHLSLQCVR